MSRPTGVFKVSNDYAEAAGRKFYADTPKAVWAALAYSLALCVAGTDAEAAALLKSEWATLHANGIVPQKAPR